jgi:hypothetical protein
MEELFQTITFKKNQLFILFLDSEVVSWSQQLKPLHKNTIVKKKYVVNVMPDYPSKLQIAEKENVVIQTNLDLKKQLKNEK